MLSPWQFIPEMSLLTIRREKRVDMTSLHNKGKLTLYSFAPVHFLDSEGVWKNAAVPSRLYFTPTKEKPLAGQRITIKDNYRLSGVKSTFSSRAYEATYGPDNETAVFVQQLMKLGAVIVGKSKMSSFASAEEPTDQWVDFHAPFNPRGDGYQTPAGSSNGAAAALSGYPWLDFCFGTDSRHPRCAGLLLKVG